MKNLKKLLSLCLMVFFLVIHITTLSSKAVIVAHSASVSVSSEEFDDERAILPLNQISIIERQAITLKVLQSSDILLPGDTVVFEAMISPDVDYVHDTLYLDSALRGERGILTLKEDGNGVYRGESQILDEHVGLLWVLASIPEIDTENNSLIIYYSNAISLQVAPDMSKISEIKFRSNPLVLVGGTESILLVACDNSDGDTVYVLSNVEELKFSIQDSSIGEITGGVLKAKSVGKTTITASLYGLMATCELKVIPGGLSTIPPIPGAVTGVTLTPTSANLAIDLALQLTASVIPSNAEKLNVTCSSSRC